MGRLVNPLFSRFSVITAGILLAGQVFSAETGSAPDQATENPQTPRDYSAIYKVLRNDKELAAVTVNLSHQQDVWKLHGYSHDTRGIARFLNMKGTQTTTGKWKEGQFRPDKYSYSASLIGFKRTWDAFFDWQNATIKIQDKHGEIQLPMHGDAIDPFSLSLNLSSQLVGNSNQMSAKVVDDDEIKTHVYRAEPQVRIDSPLGCLNTTLVTRVRENSKRISLGWYARDYQYIPVRIQHKNKKGSQLELMIVSLEVEGVPVQVTMPCA
jgi:hypothetical protein